MKYSEAEKRIKALSSKYDIDMGDKDFNIVYNGNSYGIYVSGPYRYGIYVEDARTFSKLPFSDEIYTILAELAITPVDERVEEKKRYVKVQDGNLGYLNIINVTGRMTVDNSTETMGVKTRFTDKEIEELKQRDDIPLDWGKVHFEDAE